MAASERWTTIYTTAPAATPAPAAATAPTLAILVAEHAALLYRVAFSILRDPAAAEDIVQDVFLRLLERTPALGNLTDPRLWLIRVTSNRALDQRRRHTPAQLDDTVAQQLAAHTLPADRHLVAAQQATLVLREIDRLPRNERHALLLSAFEELTPTEIAAVLGRTPSATRALLHRARTRLLDRLAAKKGLTR